MPIRIVRRDTYAMTIELECPTCLRAVPLNPKAVEELENGLEIVMICPHCLEPFDAPPEELVLDGSLQLIGLNNGQYMVAFGPSTGPTRGIPAQLDSVAALDAFLQTLRVSLSQRRQAFADLIISTVVHVGPIQLALTLLKRTQLDA